jgi:surface antigen
VNADGSWVVTEMNYVAFNVISTRTIKPGQLGSRLVGFIY